MEANEVDKPTLRILNTTSSNLGDSLSINQLTERIKGTYGTAFYPNVYRKLQDLKAQGLINLSFIGKSSVIKLNFQNYLLIDFLSEMEIEKKTEFLKKQNNLLSLLTEMENSLADMSSIMSISSIDSARNVKLNRIEFLFLLRKTASYHDETIKLYNEMRGLQNKYNLRIDSLVLGEDDFSAMLRSDEINPLREALARKIVLFCPQAFWRKISGITQETEIKTIPAETKPAGISNLDLVYNLDRFGYRQFGSPIGQGRKLCIEYVTTALLLKGDARRLMAIPVILTKNTFRGNLLAFLSQKFGTAGKLLGLLRALSRIKPAREIGGTIAILETFNVEEIPADERNILQKMRLYNAA
jgi:Fe2+ or Zn2+ uptake regulation protein